MERSTGDGAGGGPSVCASGSHLPSDYRSSLEEDIQADTSGYLERILVCLLQVALLGFLGAPVRPTPAAGLGRGESEPGFLDTSVWLGPRTPARHGLVGWPRTGRRHWWQQAPTARPRRCMWFPAFLRPQLPEAH